MSPCSSAISSKVCDRTLLFSTGKTPTRAPKGELLGRVPCGLPHSREGRAGGETHIFLLPLEFTVQTLHFSKPLPEGEFCRNPLSLQFIVGLHGVSEPGQRRVVAFVRLLF